jgi:hypothetical protein
MPLLFGFNWSDFFFPKLNWSDLEWHKEEAKGETPEKFFYLNWLHRL